MSQLDLELRSEDAKLEQLHHDLRFVASTVAEIAASLPVQRRPPSDATKHLHIAVTIERRAGYCPCCQRTPVCDVNGKFPGAEFDHWFSRYRNSPAETWLVCGPCNRALESADFKTAARSAFEAYQQALAPFLATGQANLFR